MDAVGHGELRQVGPGRGLAEDLRGKGEKLLSPASPGPVADALQVASFVPAHAPVEDRALKAGVHQAHDLGDAAPHGVAEEGDAGGVRLGEGSPAHLGEEVQHVHGVDVAEALGRGTFGRGWPRKFGWRTR